MKSSKMKSGKSDRDDDKDDDDDGDHDDDGDDTIQLQRCSSSSLLSQKYKYMTVIVTASLLSQL